MQRLAIISGCDHDRTLSAANHQTYANAQELLYIHDTAPAKREGYGYKLDKIDKFLDPEAPIAEYLFWIDDDGFFMQPETDLRRFIDENPTPDLIFCESPVNQHRGRDIKTFISSGNFFIRSTDRARAFIRAARDLPLQQVRQWWDESAHGFFSNGDQDAMVYLLHEDERFNSPDFFTRLSYEAFNCRPQHFVHAPDEHFLVHFTGRNKTLQIAQFAGRFGLSQALIPHHTLDTMRGLRRPNRLQVFGRAARLALRSLNSKQQVGGDKTDTDDD